jgi:hypothetical protein
MEGRKTPPNPEDPKSRASLTTFRSLANSRIIWDLETQKQYTVESVVIASNREVQHFENDLDFNLTGYGSLRCEMLTQPTVTTGQVTEEARTLTAIAAGDCESPLLLGSFFSLLGDCKVFYCKVLSLLQQIFGSYSIL